MSSQFDNSTGLARLEQQNTDLALVADLLLTLARTLDLAAIRHDILQVVFALTGANHVRLAYQALGDRWEASTLARGHEQSEEWTPSAMAQSLLKEGKPIVISKGQEPGLNAYIGLPLLHENVLIGMLEVEDLPVPDRMDDYLHTLSLVAGAASLALENARLHQNIRQANERFRLAAAAVHSGIYEWDIPTDQVFWTEGITELFGYPREEVKPTMDWWFNHVHPEDSNGVRQQVAAAVAGGSDLVAEYRVITKDNRYLTVWNRGRVVTGSDGNVVRMVGSVEDITERKLAEEALAVERERLAVTLRSIGDGMIATDTEGRVVLMNCVAEALTGWTQEEAAGKPLNQVFRIINERTRQPSENPARKVLETGTIAGLANHTALIARDGTETSIADSAAPIRDAQGNILGIVLVFRDITRENQAQAERERLLAEVERRATELDELNKELETFAEALGKANEELRVEVQERTRAEERLRESLEELNQRQAEVAALLEGSQAVLRYPHFEDSARSILASCKSIIKANVGMVALLTLDGSEFDEMFVSPEDLPCGTVRRLPMVDRGPQLEARRSGKASFENDVANTEWVRALPQGHLPLENVLFTPLVIEGRSLGLLGLANKPGGFSDNDAYLAMAFGEIAAIALNNSRTLEALTESEEGFRLLTERARDAVFRYRLSPVRKLEYVSPAFTALTGYTLDALDAAPDLQTRLVHPEDQALAETIIQSPELFIKPVALRWIRKDGAVIWVEEVISPLYEEGGNILAIECTARDITDRRRAEEELERLRNEFLGMVTHELRTPLTAIKGAASTGTESSVSLAEARDLFQIVNGQADRLRELVNNLLDMTRIEAGVLTVTPEAMDIRPVLEEARATFMRAGGRNDVLLEMTKDLPRVNADRNRILQVLMNLLNNAASSSMATEPIQVGLECDGFELTVHVRDRGRGIPRGRIGDLFKKFSQVHDDRLTLGTGLGLAICKGLVESHGGRIWAQSEGERKGSTFSFTLPVSAEKSASPASVGDSRPQAKPVRKEGEGRRILAVDDEVEILRYLQRCLEGAGYQAKTTSDPSQVARLVDMEEPDLVLLDLMLPGTNGFDLLRRIREFSQVPVIFLTGRTQNEDMVRALKMGADDYITKPFAPSELLARLEVVLRRRDLLPVSGTKPNFVLKEMVINFAERRVTLSGKDVTLTATEHKLLVELASNAGRVLTYDEILRRVWGPEYSGEPELVRSFVRNLRRKLGDDAGSPRFILTERQVGYLMPK
ncbi:MAG: PAS domain S-box protein [Chloroflexi bacterium]|nr:PAS domain S-box protein [Chloroflexota bacterium]